MRSLSRFLIQHSRAVAGVVTLTVPGGQDRITTVASGCTVATGVCAAVYYISQGSASAAVLPSTLALITVCWRPKDRAAGVAQVVVSALFVPRMLGVLGEELPVLPGCFVLPVIGAFAHLSVTRHLVVCFWLNACLFGVSHNWKVWLTSALVTLWTTLGVLIKLRWLQQQNTIRWSQPAFGITTASSAIIVVGMLLEGSVMLGAGPVTWQLIGGVCALSSVALRYLPCGLGHMIAVADHETMEYIQTKSAERLFKLAPFFYVAAALKVLTGLWFPQILSTWVIIDSTNGVFWVSYAQRNKWNYSTLMRVRWWWQHVIFPARLILESYGMIPAGIPWLTFGFQAVCATVLQLSFPAHLSKSGPHSAHPCSYSCSDYSTLSSRRIDIFNEDCAQVNHCG